jgi:hypothetical protein
MSGDGRVESLAGKPAAAAVLARGGSAAEAAKSAGVAESTISRRKAPGFCADVDRLTEAVRLDVTAQLSEASEALASEALQSVRVLAELRDSAESPQVRRGAARDILTLCLELREHVVLEERLTELEARVEASESAERGRFR